MSVDVRMPAYVALYFSIACAYVGWLSGVPSFVYALVLYVRATFSAQNARAHARCASLWPNSQPLPTDGW